ncbi:MAG: ATP-binding protein [Eubacterium sp.]|nr:ATP-binding protein [Eubacterium sp.]
MIGRETEVKQLNRLYNSGKAELVAIYGRRRVGKTYLVDEVFEGRFTFRHAGLAPSEGEDSVNLRAQLDHFYKSLDFHGMPSCDKPETWADAFFLLEKHLQSIDDGSGSRQLLFIDELPWLDTPRSGFLRAFEGFWNTWGCHRKNLMVIVCGSANSWILDNLINNHGGLYNRVTYEIKLLPFTLGECEQFYEEADIAFSRYDMIQSYMIVGGIPYYMGYMDRELSLAQNIDRLFFEKKAVLSQEYDRLFSSVFTTPEKEKAIVRLLSARNAGFTRREIAGKLGISDGGNLSRHLNALVASDFIIKYVPFGFSKREEHYKLIDPFCLFYLHFMGSGDTMPATFWEQNISSPAINAWRGYAFENVCWNHIRQIKRALGIEGVISTESAWSKREDDEKGTQIDLLILRNDNVVNMCEIKYYSDDFEVDQAYYKTIFHRQELLRKNISRKSAIHSTLITTFGLKRNKYAGAFTNVLTMEELF